MRRYRDAIFDADGTVLDTIELAIEVANDILALVAPTKVKIQSRAAMREAFAAERLIDTYGPRADILRALHPWVCGQRLVRGGARPYEPIMDLVSALGNPPIITAGYASAVAAGLGSYRGRFGDILGAEHGPKIDLLKIKMSELRSPVYITDTVRDIERCSELDLPVVAVAWGYDSPEELAAAGCGPVAMTADELALRLLQ